MTTGAASNWPASSTASAVLRRSWGVSTALAVLEAGQFDAAPVVMSTTDPRLIGCVHEADLLRSYIEEADRMRREDLGGVGLFAHEGAATEEE